MFSLDELDKFLDEPTCEWGLDGEEVCGRPATMLAVCKGPGCGKSAWACPSCRADVIPKLATVRCMSCGMESTYHHVVLRFEVLARVKGKHHG